MRILDMDDNEVKQEDIDLEKGNLISDQLIIKEHPAQEYIQSEKHYKVKTFFFSDGTEMSIEDEYDPHVKVIDLDNGVFGYNNLPGEEEKSVHGIELEYVIDKEGQEPMEAWTEYEDIQRWQPYTEEELKAHKEEQERMEKQQNFLEIGPDVLERLQGQTAVLTEDVSAAKETLDDMVLMMADIVNL